jgi:hypothetical protein
VDVSYEVHARLLDESGEFLSVCKTFYVFNKNTRKVLNGEAAIEEPFDCCFCIPRGLSRVSIGHITPDHQKWKSSKFYKVSLISDTNTSLQSLLLQIEYNLIVIVPGKEYRISRILSRTAPNLHEIIGAATDISNIPYDYQADLNIDEQNDNPSSNDSSLFASVYTIQAFATYAAGCGSKILCCELETHINPNTPSKDLLTLPTKWNPEEYLITNLIAESMQKSVKESE